MSLYETADNATDSNLIDLFPTAKVSLPKATDDIGRAINAFMQGETDGHWGKYYIHGDMLVYKVVVRHTSKRRYHTMAIPPEVQANVIARRIGRHYLGNSSVLGLIGRRVAFGNEKLNRQETEVQRRLSSLVPMIPFNVFHEAKLDLADYRLIARGPEESITRTVSNGWTKSGEPKFKDETVHFTGASLFKIQDKYFLFDIDRREVEHKVFNAFLVELPHAASSIADAYESLKPDEVKRALAKGLDVKRQGEWFFIPVKGDDTPDCRTDADRERWEPEQLYRPLILQAGPNRPNTAEMGIEAKAWVKGKIEHSGREHATLFLKTWHKAVPNTATRSFTITGDVD